MPNFGLQHLNNHFNSDRDQFIHVTLQCFATAQIQSEKAETFFPCLFYISLHRVSSDLQSEVFFFSSLKDGENVLITWFSIADKQDKLYHVYAAPALTNQRANLFVYFNQNSQIWLLSSCRAKQNAILL